MSDDRSQGASVPKYFFPVATIQKNPESSRCSNTHPAHRGARSSFRSDLPGRRHDIRCVKLPSFAHRSNPPAKPNFFNLEPRTLNAEPLILNWPSFFHLNRRHHAGFGMRLDMAMRQPDSGMLGNKTDGNTFPGAYQNGIPGK